MKYTKPIESPSVLGVPRPRGLQAGTGAQGQDSRLPRRGRLGVGGERGGEGGRGGERGIAEPPTFPEQSQGFRELEVP